MKGEEHIFKEGGLVLRPKMDLLYLKPGLSGKVLLIIHLRKAKVDECNIYLTEPDIFTAYAK